ncbi:MAG TPA: RsmB/NOP family class I SAM-dependent RNA methyltransferase [Xanthobacteraceae bacterium]|nr:RsmB/NOP family class I SAM-dependent RNA methyltransferase [Xanthobacteraceae bacterium]
MSHPQQQTRDDAPGFAARRVAADIIDGVLRRARPLDEQLDGRGAHVALAHLADRDRALVRRIVATVLRRLGSLRHVIGGFLERGLPRDAPRAETALLIGAAQILLLDAPAHAAVDLSVRIAQADRQAARYAGLINAVLRRMTREGAARLAASDPAALDTPEWLLRRWSEAYGEATARAIATANANEPALDLTVKDDAAEWAGKLRGRVLPTGSLRTLPHGPVPLMPGFAEGAWWVQDAAAALPARLLGDIKGARVADFCAAPGGKTLQLAQAGAHVTAIDRSEPRLARLRENLERCGLAAEVIAADAAEWTGGPFDAVLIDAPCSSSGTIRRHPDIAWLKRAADLGPLTALQRRLLERAITLVRPGGCIVFCTCSLEPEEGEQMIAAALADHPEVRRRPISVNEFSGLHGMITPAGELRTLPCQWPDAEPRMAGLDGFFAARLERI